MRTSCYAYRSHAHEGDHSAWPARNHSDLNQNNHCATLFAGMRKAGCSYSSYRLHSYRYRQLCYPNHTMGYKRRESRDWCMMNWWKGRVNDVSYVGVELSKAYVYLFLVHYPFSNTSSCRSTSPSNPIACNKAEARKEPSRLAPRS